MQTILIIIACVAGYAALVLAVSRFCGTAGGDYADHR